MTIHEDNSTTSVTEDNETRAEAFIRLANARMTATLDKVRLIGNLASPAYDYTPEQVEKMRAHLINYIDHTFAKFNKTKKKEETCFEL